ncbi:MAG: hypothetical protein ACOZAO_01655 [Patescibacteria group bacterium]
MSETCAMNDFVFSQMRCANSPPQPDTYYLVETYGTHPVELKGTSTRNFNRLAYNQAVFLKTGDGIWHRAAP